MTKAEGQCRINAVQVGEATVEVFKSPGGMESPSLSAKLALVDSATGNRCGYIHRNAWSEETLTLLSRLLESMERDAIVTLFEGEGQGTTTTGSGLDSFFDEPSGPPGL